MDHEKSDRSSDLKDEVLRLLEDCRRLLEQTGDVAKRLQDLTDKLSDDHPDRKKTGE